VSTITRTRKIVANNIIYFRISKNMSQEDLAELLETSPGYVSEIENAKRNLSCDYIDLIANIFQIEPHELFVDRPPVTIRRINRHKKL
jgi:transcriptional regulator with XRE-family HTH domain